MFDMNTVPALKTKRTLPLAVGLVLAALLVSGVAWFIIDIYQSRRLEGIFVGQLERGLHQSAQRDRLRFDEQMRTQATFAHLLAGNRQALAGLERMPPPDKDGLPIWTPEPSIWPSLVKPDAIVRLDHSYQPVTVYRVSSTDLPTELQHPSLSLVLAAEQQAILASFDDKPYVLAAAMVPDGTGQTEEHLITASLVDGDFLLRGQAPYLEEGAVVALIGSSGVLTSSAPSLVPTGTTLATLRQSYLVTDKSYFDWGQSDLRASFISLVPIAQKTEMIGPILEMERNHRALLALVISASFLAALLYLSLRLRRLMRRVDDFAQQAFGVVPEDFLAGDELSGLERQIERLTAEVVASRQALEADVFDRLALSLDQLRTKTENERLLTLRAVTDFLGVGVIRFDASGPTPQNETMSQFAAACGGLEAFVAIAASGQDMELICRDGGKRLFEIDRPTGLGAGVLLVRDVTEQRRAEKDVRDFALFSAQNPYPVLRLAPDGILLHANSASNELLPVLGATRGHRVAEPWRNLVALTLGEDRPHDVEVSVGERIFALIFVSVPTGPYVNVYSADITARKAAEQALTELNESLEFLVTERTRALQAEITKHVELEVELVTAKEQAETASRTKSEFLANMSHELRTPLNAIIGFSELMSAEVFGSLGHANYTGYARDIQSSGHHLLEVINDILDISKVESGRMEMYLEPSSVKDIIQAAVRLVRGRLEQAGLRLQISVPDELPIILVDRRRLKQVLVNLLSNAAKFTPSGGTVRLGAMAGTPGVTITVSDTGIGMSKEEQRLAMEPFRQVDSGLARRQDGTGLGLPLSRSFVQLQGGTFLLESTKNVGTTVTLTFTETALAATE